MMTDDLSWLEEDAPHPEALDAKLRRLFDGRIVRKALTKNWIEPLMQQTKQ